MKLVTKPHSAFAQANCTWIECQALDCINPVQVPEPTVKLFINLTQPLLPTGQLRWALNNVAYTKNPPCSPLLDLVAR